MLYTCSNSLCLQAQRQVFCLPAAKDLILSTTLHRTDATAQNMRGVESVHVNIWQLPLSTIYGLSVVFAGNAVLNLKRLGRSCSK